MGGQSVFLRLKIEKDKIKFKIKIGICCRCSQCLEDTKTTCISIPNFIASSAGQSSATRQWGNSQLEDALRLVRGERDNQFGNKTMYRVNSFDSVNHYAYGGSPDSAMPEQQVSSHSNHFYRSHLN